MSVKRVNGGYAVVHCHGAEKDKPIKTYKGKNAKNKALKMHRAIQANK